MPVVGSAPPRGARADRVSTRLPAAACLVAGRGPEGLSRMGARRAPPAFTPAGGEALALLVY